MSLRVVGVDHPNRKPRTRGKIPRRFEIAACAPGEPVDLILEPDNPADPLAVMVFSARGIQLGYVQAERAPLVGKHIRQGDDVVAVFQAATEWGALIRVTFDGADPVVPQPPATEFRTDDSGFFPDPIWDDE